jgi:hypothetical protein
MDFFYKEIIMMTNKVIRLKYTYVIKEQKYRMEGSEKVPCFLPHRIGVVEDVVQYAIVPSSFSIDSLKAKASELIDYYNRHSSFSGWFYHFDSIEDVPSEEIMEDFIPSSYDLFVENDYLDYIVLGHKENFKVNKTLSNFLN